jgi:hypothetical protein
MVDDVYQDADRQPPDPTTNDNTYNNNYKAHENKDSKMEGK